MAKQVGVFKFTGKLGNLVGYKLNGRYITRSIGAIDRHKMRTAPQYAVTRMNQSLFATASQAGKMFRQAILPFTTGFTDHTYPPQVVSLMLRALKAGNGESNGSIPLYSGLKQSHIQQGFRKLPIYNHYTSQHIPTTLLQFTGRPHQYTLNQQALWRKSKSHDQKIVQFGYIHFDCHTMTSQYQPLLSATFSREESLDTTSIQFPSTRHGSSTFSFLIVQVYNHQANCNLSILQNIFILDVFDNSLIPKQSKIQIQTNNSHTSRILKLIPSKNKLYYSLALHSRFGDKRLRTKTVFPKSDIPNSS